MLLCSAMVSLTLPVQAATTEVRVVKYGVDGTTVLDKTTVTYQWMEANLPVQGDGVTHYYHQGPVFEGKWNSVHPGEPYNMWNPKEDVNVESRDYGAVKGTDVMDLCNLVGGMSSGDEVKIKSPDGFHKWFGYENVYNPDPEQGTLVVCWFNGDESSTEDPQGTGYTGAFPGYYVGMRLIFFSDTSTNPWGYHCFGHWNMHEYLAEKYWHYYQTYPSTSGLSVKYVSDILIYSTQTITSCDSDGNVRDQFATGESVWVKGIRLVPGTTYKIWIQDEQVSGGKTLDTNEDLSGSQETVTTDVNGNFAPIKIWNSIDVSVTYDEWDIVADKSGSGEGTYNANDDGIDSAATAGLTLVPELSTILLTGIGLLGMLGYAVTKRRR